MLSSLLTFFCLTSMCQRSTLNYKSGLAGRLLLTLKDNDSVHANQRMYVPAILEGSCNHPSTGTFVLGGQVLVGKYLELEIGVGVLGSARQASCLPVKTPDRDAASLSRLPSRKKHAHMPFRQNPNTRNHQD